MANTAKVVREVVRLVAERDAALAEVERLTRSIGYIAQSRDKWRDRYEAAECWAANGDAALAATQAKLTAAQPVVDAAVAWVAAPVASPESFIVCRELLRAAKAYAQTGEPAPAEVVCPDCGGEGHHHRTCETCGGTGTVTQEGESRE